MYDRTYVRVARIEPSTIHQRYIPYRGALFPIPSCHRSEARTTIIDYHDVTLEISKRRRGRRGGWSLVLSVKHLRGVINSGAVQGASRRAASQCRGKIGALIAR